MSVCGVGGGWKAGRGSSRPPPSWHYWVICSPSHTTRGGGGVLRAEASFVQLLVATTLCHPLRQSNSVQSQERSCGHSLHLLGRRRRVLSPSLPCGQGAPASPLSIPKKGSKHTPPTGSPGGTPKIWWRQLLQGPSRVSLTKRL